MPDTLNIEVITLVRSYWRDYERPLLLSALGGRLSEQARAELAVTGQTLGGLVADQLAGDVRLISAPGRGGAAVPADMAAGISDDDLNARIPPVGARANPGAAPTRQIIWPELWAVFRDGLGQAGSIGVEICGSKLVVHRLAVGQQAQADWYVIEPDDVTAPDLPGGRRSPGVVGNAVRSWATRVGLPLAKLEQPLQENRAPYVSSALTARVQKWSVLASFAEGMAVLPHEDLARIMIPADVVVRLIQKADFRS